MIYKCIRTDRKWRGEEVKYTEREGVACGGWSSLPADLLQVISRRLSSDADHLSIHQVCTHWRASTSSLAVRRPWVVAGGARRRGLLPIGDYSLHLPLGGAQRVEVGAPPASLPYCCGASRGWLALVDDDRSPTRLVLWEPLSNTEVPLPCLSPLTRIFLSDDPLASPNWIAVASQLKDLIGQTTHFWRPGDAAWTMMYGFGTFEIDSVAFIEGKAYYIDVEPNIIICDFNTGADLPLEWTWIFRVCYLVNNLCRCNRLHPVRGVHLVACSCELLLVVLRWGSHPSLAEVYKLEWMRNQSMELRERVMDLGDYSLFVVQGDTFALSAKEFPMIKSNCVYYVNRPQEKQHWISVFHLESGALEEIPYMEKLKEGRTNRTPYVWFCPRKPFLKQTARNNPTRATPSSFRTMSFMFGRSPSPSLMHQHATLQRAS